MLGLIDKLLFFKKYLLSIYKMPRGLNNNTHLASVEKSKHMKKYVLGMAIMLLFWACDDYIKIPDEKFEQLLINKGYDSTKKLDGKISVKDASGITNIDIAYDTTIHSIKGVQSFINLKSLVISYNGNIHNIDVSKLTNLERLDVSATSISRLNVSNNSKMRQLFCHTLPNLTKLDVSKLCELDTLACQSTGITKIDLRKNKKLVLFEALQLKHQIEVCVNDTSKIPKTWSRHPTIKYVTCY